MSRVFAVFLLLTAMLMGTSVRADSASLFAQAKSNDSTRYASAISKGASFSYTSDNRSFYGWWQPTGWTPSAGVIVALHGTGSYATSELSLWQPYAEARGHAVLALSWWFGSGDKTSDYYTPSEIYPLVSAVLKDKGVSSGQVMFAGFSRGSANSYAVAAMDYASGGSRYFGLVLSNAGGAALDYPPNQEITKATYGTSPFSGIKWAMYCGEKDPNPDRDGCNAMKSAKTWVTQYGATMVLFIEDPSGDHGGFMTNSSNVNQALDQYKTILSSSASSTSTLTLTKGSTTLLASSSVFGGIVHDGSQLVVSYAKGNDLYVRPYDSSFNALSAEKKVTAVGNLIDHKHIFFNDAHYLVYSTLDEKDLYLMKLDKNLVQSGTTVAVTQGSTTTKTNDMLLATDGTYIVTGQFRPSNLNSNQTTGHLIKRYDTSLNYVSPDITLNKFEHANTAALLKVGNYMTLVAPSSFVKGGQVSTQRDLLLMRFDTSFNAVDTSAKKIVDSATLVHANGDGIWMSTGLAYDAKTDKLIVGHTFINGTSGSDKGKILLRVFDGTTFAETYSETMIDSIMANRAHFVLLNDTLYVVYDDTTSGAPIIYGLSYALTRASPVTTYPDCLFNWAEDTAPTLFKPTRPTTETFGDYTLRRYPTTNTYLGISGSNSRLYYYAPTSSSNAMLDLGLAATWKTLAGCQ